MAGQHDLARGSDADEASGHLPNLEDSDLGGRLRSVGRILGQPASEPGAVVTRQIGMIGLAGVLLAAAALVFAVDASVARAMRYEPDGVRAFLDIVTDAALIAWYFYPALLLSLALFLFRPQSIEPATRARVFVMSAWFAASLGTASAITHAIKYMLGRARPELLDSHGIASFEILRLGSAFKSFPSGHSTNAGVVAMALAIWFPAMRWPILLAGACLALTRIVVERHYLSDVVAGLAIGTVTALALARFLALRRIVYRVEAGGRGWSGLLPYRGGASL